MLCDPLLYNLADFLLYFQIMLRPCNTQFKGSRNSVKSLKKTSSAHTASFRGLGQ